MKQYVVGFMFNDARDQVVLIKKNRPEWQKGRYNGVGGHVEEGEAPEVAMAREFFEETGVLWPDWEFFAQLRTGDNAEVYFYRAISNEVYECRSTTDEQIGLHDVASLFNSSWENSYIPNLHWLIPMALYSDDTDPKLTPYTGAPYRIFEKSNAPPAPKERKKLTDIFFNDKLVMIGLPPQNWLLILTGHMAFHLDPDATAPLELDRATFLSWHALLLAAKESPSGYDQDVTEISNWLDDVATKNEQPPPTQQEMEVIRATVRRYSDVPG